MTDINETGLKGQAAKTLKEIDALIAYYKKAKGSKPEYITVTRKQYELFGKNQELITRDGVELRV